jgi:hypothetical protein
VVGTSNGVVYGGVTLVPDRLGSNQDAYGVVKRTCKSKVLEQML